MLCDIYRPLVILVKQQKRTAVDEIIIKSGKFLARDHLVIDLQNGVEWMRCSYKYGMGVAVSEALKLSQEDVSKAIVIQ